MNSEYGFAKELARVEITYQKYGDDQIQEVELSEPLKKERRQVIKLLTKVENPELIFISTFDTKTLSQRLVTEYRTCWRTQLQHPNEAFRNEIEYDYLKSGYLNGRSISLLMPWNIPESHLYAIKFIARNLFEGEHYTGVRLYGSVEPEKETLSLVKATGSVLTLDDEIKTAEFYIVFSNLEGVNIWKYLNRDVKVQEIEEMGAKRAAAALTLYGVYKTRDYRQIVGKKYIQSAVFEEKTLGLRPLTAVNLARENQLQTVFMLFNPAYSVMRELKVLSDHKASRELLESVWKKIMGTSLPANFPTI
jgi:hypothetical protein